LSDLALAALQRTTGLHAVRRALEIRR